MGLSASCSRTHTQSVCSLFWISLAPQAAVDSCSNTSCEGNVHITFYFASLLLCQSFSSARPVLHCMQQGQVASCPRIVGLLSDLYLASNFFKVFSIPDIVPPSRNEHISRPLTTCIVNQQSRNQIYKAIDCVHTLLLTCYVHIYTISLMSMRVRFD